MKKPAFLGGEPAFPDGPPNWPPLDPDVSQAVAASLTDGSWGKYHGPRHAELTTELADIHGVEFVTPCCSGTVAVELALRGLAVGAGDEVILAGYDFPGNFRAVEAVGALPVLVDTDPRVWSLDPQLLPQAISSKTRAVIVSHLHGGTAAMAEIVAWARAHSVSVLEDACQSPLAEVDGGLAGTWGDAAVLSFGGSKLLTAGRGGAVLTRHAEIHQRMKVFADRGNQAFPLSELQAAVLLPQLKKLQQRNGVRAKNVARLLANLAGVHSLCPVATHTPDDQAVYYKLAWRVTLVGSEQPLIREDLIAALQAEGLAVDSGFRGFVRRSARRCRQATDLTHSSAASDSTLLLHHPVLLESVKTIDLAADTIRAVIAALDGL